MSSKLISSNAVTRIPVINGKRTRSLSRFFHFFCVAIAFSDPTPLSMFCSTFRISLFSRYTIGFCCRLFGLLTALTIGLSGIYPCVTRKLKKLAKQLICNAIVVFASSFPVFCKCSFFMSSRNLFTSTPVTCRRLSFPFS